MRSRRRCPLNCVVVAVALVLSVAGAQKDPHYEDARSTMVHLFEWKFSDIANECEEYLGPNEYGGVQVSPINENMVIENRPWWERYQPLSMKIVSRSGNLSEFRKMVKRCNAANVRIYVDAVFNHMTTDQSPAIGTGGDVASPSERDYPAVPYNSSDFHKWCQIENYGNATEVRDCQLGGLHDLDQSRESVRGPIVDFLNEAVDAGVAGFRIDAAKHMWPEDLEVIYGRVKNLSTEHGFPPNSRPFFYQEVIDLGGEAVSKREYTDLGRVVEFTYGIVLGSMFRGEDDLAKLENWGNGWGLLPSEDALVMIDNHDNQRGHGAGGASILTYKLPRRYKMATAFMLAHPYGTTRVMSSFYFNNTDAGPPSDQEENILSPGACGSTGWVCEHRWPQIRAMNIFRNVVRDEPLLNWWTDGKNQIAFSRGSRGFLLINAAEDADLNETLTTGMPAGSYCDVISGNKIAAGKCSGIKINVADDGRASFFLPRNASDGVIAIHLGSKL